jgi:hypothetical protein
VSSGAGFGDVQPRFVYCVPLEDRSLDDVFSGFNQLWRRNVRKAEKSGVQVRLGTREDLADFHRVYVETAERDHFTPRGQVYFERMWDALNSANDGYHEMTLHLAEYDGHLAAATIMIRVGNRAWYSYGASTTADRDVRPSNALQWDMITRAHEAGCTRLRPPRHLRHPRSRQPPDRLGALQGRQRRVRTGVRGRVGLRASQDMGTRVCGLRSARGELGQDRTDGFLSRYRCSALARSPALRGRRRAAFHSGAGVVPVIKGNGYGLGAGVLGAEAMEARSGHHRGGHGLRSR